MLSNKLDALRKKISGFESALIAFSGEGYQSTFKTTDLFSQGIEFIAKQITHLHLYPVNNKKPPTQIKYMQQRCQSVFPALEP